MAESRSDEDWKNVINEVLLRHERESGQEYPHYSRLNAGIDLAKYIDHTLLKVDATRTQIDQLCEEAKEFKFKSVCVRLPFVARCTENLMGSGVTIACVVGFHEGTYATAEKVQEAIAAVRDGATELDMVLNYGNVKSKSYCAAFFDVDAVRKAVPAPLTLKVILETSQLSREEIVAASVVALAAGADFLKTSTGFNGRGGSQDDVRLMKSIAGDSAKVKASGGVRNMQDAMKMIKAGADRIGASSGVTIVQGMSSAAASY